MQMFNTDCQVVLLLGVYVKHTAGLIIWVCLYGTWRVSCVVSRSLRHHILLRGDPYEIHLVRFANRPLTLSTRFARVWSQCLLTSSDKAGRLLMFSWWSELIIDMHAIFWCKSLIILIYSRIASIHRRALCFWLGLDRNVYIRLIRVVELTKILVYILHVVCKVR